MPLILHRNCPTCSDFGYAQTYAGGRVERGICWCRAGRKRETEMDVVCREVGLVVAEMRPFRVRCPRPSMPWADLTIWD